MTALYFQINPFSYYRRLLPAILMVFSFKFLSAQEPVVDSNAGDQIALDEVLIRAEAPEKATDIRQGFMAGQERRPLDSIILRLYDSRSLRELLVEQSPVFVKSYGVNSMATLSFRGASSAQSAVLWNGIPVANPALGVTDISVLQTGLFDAVALQYGSSAALFGSGNVGGALLLEQAAPEFSAQRHLESGLSIGSYGHFNYQLKGRLETNRFRVDWKGFYQVARNDFSYRKAGERRSMENAALAGLGGILTLDYNLAKAHAAGTHVLRASVWTQRFERELPPALFEPLSRKKQTDQSTRTLLAWEKAGSRFTYYAKGAFSRMQLAFEQDPWRATSENEVYQTYMEAGVKVAYETFNAARRFSLFPLLQETLLFTSLQYDYEGNAAGTSGPAMRLFRPAMALAHNVRSANGRYQINAALRLEGLNGAGEILLPGIGGEAIVWDRQYAATDYKLGLRVNFQRTYRQPGLNELYFEPGGNPDLKPEQGWSKDAGYSFKVAGYKDNAAPLWRFEHTLSGFDRNIRDWIYWLGGAIWTPHNLATVHSRGVETDNKLSFFFGDFGLEAGFKTAYTLATTTASYLPDDNSIGKQIPYTPRYNLAGHLRLSFRKLLISYAHTYTGYRFVTVDESQYLAPYNIGTLQLNYQIKRGSGYIDLGFTVLNCWDHPLEVVRGRPGPGRHYRLYLRFGF